MNQYIPVSVAHFDQAMANLRQTIKSTVKTVDDRDELAALHRQISELEKERDDARAGAIELEEVMEDRCQIMKEIHDAAMDDKIAQSLAAVNRELERMTDERDRWSKRADNLLEKLSQVESNYDSLLQREDALKQGLRVQVDTLQKTVRDQEQAIKVLETSTSPTTRSSAPLADLVRERDEKYKGKINQLTRERDEALSQLAVLSGQQDTSRKRRHRKK